ncbi:MAG: HesA/MoeB/ThiF family protein [Flavobacterium sp.]|nr:HesA/MoeB/ThiF family protein [Flavobacterium sp.]
MNTSQYNRQIILPEVGVSGQEKLLNAKVLLVGVGGLGAAVLPYLVAAGVGEIGLIDDDIVDESNLQRQVIYKNNSVGKRKVAEAKTMALDLNPNVKVNTFDEKLNPKNAISLFENYDIVVDATDNLKTKYLINDASVVTKTPFVYGSVFKFEGQVSVFNYQNGPSYRCLFSEQNLEAANCNESGVLGVSVGIIGMLQANEVLKMILEIGEVLSGKLLVYNLLTNDQQKFEFSKSNVELLDKQGFDMRYKTDENLVAEITALDALEFKTDLDVLFLDVRNLEETPKLELKNKRQIPLETLENEISGLDKNALILVYWQSGIRSKKAVEILRKQGFKSAKSIIGGALALERIMNQTIVVC